MGLSISYGLKVSATVKTFRQAAYAVSLLRERALGLPFQEVSELGHLQGRRADYTSAGPDDPWHWLLIQSQGHVEDPQDSRRTYSVVPLEVVVFRTWPGEGCEEANFGLCRYPARIGPIETKLDEGWRWSSFCKTQYANDPRHGGVGNFLKCHLAVVALLDEAKSIGMLGEVSDEGDYWTNRDPAALAREVGRWDEFVAALGGALKDVLAEGSLAMQAPIFARSNFEHLEARGVADPKTAKVVELIRRTAARKAA